jgi:flagellar basal-body rod modification protein FlgD
MAQVGPVTGLGNVATTNATQAANSKSKDFNMFLRLMTTQMKNQDPLDPMKSSEYTQQLAQYSQVEQSVQQTSVLNQILTRMNGQDMAGAANYIGKQATFDGAISSLDSSGGSASWSYSVGRPAAAITATIMDANGRVVKEMALNPSSTSGRVVWDGLGAGGGRAAGGPYSLTVVATDANGATVPVQVSSTGMVSSVEMSGGQVVLGLSGGAKLPVSSLIAVSSG